MGGSTADPEAPAATLRRLSFSDLDDWSGDDHAAAFAAFRRSASISGARPPKRRGLGTDADALAAFLVEAAALPPLSASDARRFFEDRFEPAELFSEGGHGFFTGYYEPEVAGSRTATATFRVPLLAPPAELTGAVPGTFPDRAAITAGALAGRDLEIAFVADPVDAFFIHIQGSARIRLTDGTLMRISFAGKSGHPYTPIGRVLIARSALARDNTTMQTIRAWLAAHPDDAAAVMNANRSYIFFREAPVDDPALGPVAAAGVPLTAGRSLAVDRLLHAFHTPIWIETRLPDGAPFRRLMVAQDTGSAIVGPARGDIFFGSGAAAGEIAGAMRAEGRFVLLAPRGRP